MSDIKLTRKDLSQYELPSYVVVEGPIGVGKTTLCKMLAETLQGDSLLEDPESNPFLEKYYRGEKNAALATQLFFLMQRSQQMQQLLHQDLFQQTLVADFLIEKDQIFAELTLNPDELKLYQQVAEHLTLNSPKPDLVVYLQAPVEVLLQRIHKRGIAAEQKIDADYLTRLNEAYSRLFHYYEESPILIVNAEDLDLVNRADDYNDLVHHIFTSRTGRNYYNPHSNI